MQSLIIVYGGDIQKNIDNLKLQTLQSKIVVLNNPAIKDVINIDISNNPRGLCYIINKFILETDLFGFVGENINWHREKTSKIMDVCYEYPEVGLIYHDTNKDIKLDFSIEAYSQNLINIPQDIFITRSCLNQVGLFKESIDNHIDAHRDLIYRIASQCMIYHMPEILSYA